jgi:hypothetical protein
MTVQALAQQYQHPLSSCFAQSHYQQQPVLCSRHSRFSVIRCSAAGAASTGVEAASAAAQQQQQQPSSNGSSHQVIDMDAEEDTNEASSSSSSSPDVVIKVLTSADELQAVARLRAEAYYAVSCTAHVAAVASRFQSPGLLVHALACYSRLARCLLDCLSATINIISKYAAAYSAPVPSLIHVHCLADADLAAARIMTRPTRPDMLITC